MALVGFSARKRNGLLDIVLSCRDEELRTVLIEYLKECFEGNLLDSISEDTRHSVDTNNEGLRYILNSFRLATCNQISWQYYSMIMNELDNIHTEMKAAKKRSAHFEVILDILVDEYNIKTKNEVLIVKDRAVGRAKTILISLYLFILDKYNERFPNLSTLNIYKELIEREDLLDLLVSFKDINLRKVFLSYVEGYLSGNLLDFSDGDSRGYMDNWNQGLMYILNSFRQVTCDQVNWNYYCMIMSELNKINIKIYTEDIPSIKTETKLQIVIDENNSVVISGEFIFCNRAIQKSRDILSSLYLYILNNFLENFDGMREFENYRELLISQERILIVKPLPIPPPFIRDNIATNFPVNSNTDELYLFSYLSDNGQDMLSTIVNFRSNNPFIRQILIAFIASFYDPAFASAIKWRQFLYYFRASITHLTDEELFSIENFNYETFNKQYRFYKNANFMMQSTEYRVSFTQMLVQFYIFLFDYIEENDMDYKLFAGTKLTKLRLMSARFKESYEKGYIIFIHSRLEEYPKAMRWAIESDDSKAALSSHQLLQLDFTGLKDESFVDDLKKYYWCQKNNLLSTYVTLRVVKDFLNYKYEYDKRRSKKVINIDRIAKKPFSIDFIVDYIIYIYEKYKEQGTRRNYLKAVKTFLNYFRKKYNVDEISLKRLNVPDKTYDGGNPISPEDYALILNKFQENREKSIKDELFYIIFNFAVSTKMRLGEIMNLRRNCIAREDLGRVQYYSKTSHGELVKINLKPEKIQLIKRAIALTIKYAELAEDSLKPYIFLSQEHRYPDRILRMESHFSERFRTIVDELEGSLSNIAYTAYCLRHTFIDTIYTEATKDNLTVQQIAAITGQCPEVANKNYRNREDLVNYAEAFAGVIITDVDIDGNILEIEEQLDEFDIVLDGAGVCSESDGCKKIIEGIDDKYICLKCKSFLTSTSRIPVYKRKLRKLDEELEEATWEEEINLINAQKKLYGAYLAALLEKNEVK